MRRLRALGDTPELLQSFLGNTVRSIVIFVGLVGALSQLGIDLGPLLAAIGGAGLVLAFAFQSTLSDFAAGVHGKVQDMSLVSTTTGW